MAYVFGGILIVSLLAIILGIKYSVWIVLGLLAVYFIGLGGVVRYTIKKTSYWEKSIHINLAIILINFNREVLRP